MDPYMGEPRGGSGGAAWEPRGSRGGASARTPCGDFYGTLILLLLKPSSEFAIRESRNFWKSYEILVVVCP